ncbi:ABC transporter substrate-binding protein [Pseudorhodoferax sp.]|uniref:ABC transporter substrate-binding protein n=1 Tax=Pseudorhodoferax sp. TaxID=1993553 RepID=UPI002DD660D6|nr:ABC transporter substrate-binding protein [Pseudorhodoferax sp.]
MHRRLFTALLAAGLAFAGAAQADQLADIKQKGQLVIGVLGTDEPNSFLDPKTRELVGYEVDLGNAVAKTLGVKAVFKQIAVAARIPELQQGHVDLLAASLTHNKEREAQIDFSLTTFVTGQKAMVKKSSGVKDVPELAGKRVLTAKGGTQEPNIRKAVPTAEVVTYENSQQAFLALQQGKGVAYVNDELSLLVDIAKLGPKGQDYVMLPTNLSVEPLALGIKKGEAGFKAVVDDTLRALEKSGDAEKLYQKWFGAGTKTNSGTRTFKFETDKIAG